MKKCVLLLFMLASQFNFSQSLFQNEPTVRVRIIDPADTLKIQFNDEWILTSENITKQFLPADGVVIFTLENEKIKISKSETENYILTDEFYLQCANNNGTLRIKNVPFGVGWWWESKEDRTYEGILNFYHAKENKFEVVVHLPLEKYLMGVVPYEIGSDSPIEALKAQAVAARSEAVMALNSRRHSGEHYDLTSDVECQVFSGNDKRTENTDRAVIESSSLVLSENGKPINAYYASNCGGHSELIKNVWGDRPSPDSYNIAQADWEDTIQTDLSIEENAREWVFSNPPSFCNPSNGLPDWSQKNFRWKREFNIDEITKMTSRGKNLGSLTSIKVIKRGISGRVIHACFIFEKDSLEIKGELNIRQMFYPPLRSACFVIDKIDSGLIVHGAGWGHGVGMCQSGAIAMAKKGNDFEKILKHYYRRAELLKIY